MHRGCVCIDITPSKYKRSVLRVPPSDARLQNSCAVDSLTRVYVHIRYCNNAKTRRVSLAGVLSKRIVQYLRTYVVATTQAATFDDDGRPTSSFTAWLGAVVARAEASSVGCTRAGRDNSL